MDKIKTVKIKNEDGSISEETYTISVDAKNVDMDNGKDLQDTVGTINVDIDGNIGEQLDSLNENMNNLNIDIEKKSYYFNTVADMKVADLKNGDFACTLGYYSINDGGAAEYKIINNTNNYKEILNNGLFAELILKDIINVKRFGAKGDNNSDDYSYLQNAITYGLNNNLNIYIPAGKYKITQTLNIDNGITIELDDEAMIFCNNDIDLIKMKPYSKIKGGKLITNKSNYSKNLVSIISSPQQNIFGGLYNIELGAYNGFASGSNGIKTVYENNTNLCFFEIEDVNIRYFDCAINLSSLYTNA